MEYFPASAELNFTVAFSVAGFGYNAAFIPLDAFTCDNLQEIVQASVRTPELPQALFAFTVMLPLVLPHNTWIDALVDGPRICAPAGTVHVYDVAPVDPAVV